jgi:hypothetical protein
VAGRRYDSNYGNPAEEEVRLDLKQRRLDLRGGWNRKLWIFENAQPRLVPEGRGAAAGAGRAADVSPAVLSRQGRHGGGGVAGGSRLRQPLPYRRTPSRIAWLRRSA